MSSSRFINELRTLHEAATVLRSALTVRLGDLLPPYADEVLNDLQDITARTDPDLIKIRVLFEEAAGVMEMLPSIPAEWEQVDQAARAAGLSSESS